MDTSRENEQRERGRRAEDVGLWYLRLNGILTIPGFLVHWEHLTSHPRTEADAVGVRFPSSRESTGLSLFRDDPRIIEMGGDRVLFLIVEIKAGTCKINGPWSDRSKNNMPYVIRRLGFCRNESQVEAVSKALYDHARWDADPHYVVQYLCIGARNDPALNRSSVVSVRSHSRRSPNSCLIASRAFRKRFRRRASHCIGRDSGSSLHQGSLGNVESEIRDRRTMRFSGTSLSATASSPANPLLEPTASIRGE